MRLEFLATLRRRFGCENTVRASLAFYNTFAEIDRLADAVARLAEQTQAA